MEERQPRSAPDALRYEPGVYVQQTAHGQASTYVRGMTGQQVVHLFDGIRMNNGIYRRGPNQYFFSIDSYTLERIEVLRGSASTRYGSDALGGAILAYGREPALAAPSDGWELHPRVYGRATTADDELSGRIELEAAIEHSGLLGGVTARNVGLLTAAGPLPDSRPPELQVPRFADDGRTQLGTGFAETNFDARIVQRVRPGVELTAAAYGYRQFDAPRTDQCPPPEAPQSECLVIDEQFRTLTYLALRGDAGDYLRDLDMSVSLQLHDENRRRDRPRSFVELTWENHVRTLGASLRAATRRFAVAQGHLVVRYGVDAYRDDVDSSGEQRFTDLDLRLEQSRGQYLDGSSYLSIGAFTELSLHPLDWLGMQVGGRLAAVGARARADEASGSRAVHENWGAAVGRAGVEFRPVDSLRFHVNVDQGFRAPNLDDLTSRQQVGPGFQFENAELVPERTLSYEMGVAYVHSSLELEAWLFSTDLEDGIVRAVREVEDCPVETPACNASRTQFQLINAGDSATVWGSEGALTLHLPWEVSLRATYSYAFGEGPNTGSRETSGRDFFGDRVPLSRIPPFNGTVEARYRDLGTGLYFGSALRWALAQDRLAPSDLSDARIPPGGTPGHAVADLRAGYHYADRLRLNVVLENVFDAAYRAHGSSVNGPGRGLSISIMVGL